MVESCHINGTIQSFPKKIWSERSGLVNFLFDANFDLNRCQLTKCGVAISSEVRNIVHWRAVDKDDKVIDEQKF